MSHVIGMSGKKQSGKDTLANMLIDLARPEIMQRIAYADALKREVAQACGVTVDFLEKYKATFRPILQCWGTDFRRNPAVGGVDSYWLDRVQEAIWKSEAPWVILTDVRFPNEARQVKRLGGYLVRVHRPSNQPRDLHSSETALDDWTAWDAWVNNEGDLDDLHAIAEDLWQSIQAVLA